MKKCNSILGSLGLMLIFLLSYASVFAQNVNNDIYPKGKYNQVYTEQKLFNKLTDVYTADAAKLSTEWQNTRFSLRTVSGSQVFSTGEYLPNTVYSTTSPTIQLPVISGNEKLILQVEDKFKTESRYDYLSIKASTDGGQTWNVIYKTSGQTDWRTNYLDISRFADKNVLLSLSLNSDGTDESEGWSLKGLNIFTSNGLTGAFNSKGIGTKGQIEAAQVATIDIVNVFTDNYPDAVFVDFVPKDNNGDFVSGLDIYDIAAYDNNVKAGSCLKLSESSDSAAKPPIDIVFLMDNSGSMGDDQANVANNVTDMVNRLNQQYDTRLGLVRFGQGPGSPSGAPIVMSNPNMVSTAFFYDPTEFVNFWNSVNTVDGAYEPSYWAMHEGATNPLVTFRQNAEKIFVLITDEDITNYGNQSQYSMQDAINALNSKGIRLFAITPDEAMFYNDFSPVCNATNGVLFPNITSNFSTVFDNLIQVIQGKYTLRYCPTSIMDTIDPTQCIPLLVTLKLFPNIKDTTCYTPTPLPRIVRTPETKALDGTTQDEYIDIPVGVEILDGSNVTGVSLFYRFNSSSTPTSFTQGTDLQRQSGTNIFTGLIPANMVRRYSVEYYFVAHFPNRDVISPTQNAEYLAWSFAVDPNRAPIITNVVETTDGLMCEPIVITATITDNDGVSTLDKKILFYKPNNSVSGFIAINMTPLGTNDQYTATIPGNAMDESGVSYYILATDNFRTQGWYGTPEAPTVIPANQAPLSNYKGMRISVFSVENISVLCQSLGGIDTIKAYFTNDCGQMQEAGLGMPRPGFPFIEFYIYGDNPNTSIKDGFHFGENVLFKLTRDGRAYDLEVELFDGSTVITYDTVSGAYALCNAMRGVGIGELEVSGNGDIIMHNDVTPTPADGTDFGTTNSSNPITNGFTLYNNGCESLTINSIAVDDNANFQINLQGSSPIPVGGSTTFEVTYLAVGTSEATISIFNNGVNNPYKFNVLGRASSAPAPKSKQNTGLEKEVASDFKVYPNPVGSNLAVNVEFEVSNDDEICMLMVYDVKGNLVRTPISNTKFDKGAHQVSFNTQGLTSGTYIVTLKKGNTLSSKSLIVQ